MKMIDKEIIFHFMHFKIIKVVLKDMVKDIFSEWKKRPKVYCEIKDYKTVVHVQVNSTKEEIGELASEKVKDFLSGLLFGMTRSTYIEMKIEELNPKPIHYKLEFGNGGYGSTKFYTGSYNQEDLVDTLHDKRMLLDGGYNRAYIVGTDGSERMWYNRSTYWEEKC